MSNPFAGTSDDLVLALPHRSAGMAPSTYEFSIRLTPDGMQRAGRFAVWLERPAAADGSMLRWLEATGAPSAVRTALVEETRPKRQGAAVAMTPEGPEYRLYLHGVDPTTAVQTYRALRWRAGDLVARSSTYTFHFAPETADGSRPEDLAPVWARPGFRSITQDARMLRMSGFWLRHDAGGGLAQVDLALPWRPRADTLDGFTSLLDVLGPDSDARAWLNGLHVRHLAVKPANDTSPESPELTLYVSAPLQQAPAGESELQAAVIAASGVAHCQAMAEEARLPRQPDVEQIRGAMDSFYSGPVDTWRAVLGDALHYHHGLFEDPELDPDDAAMLTASRKAVSDLYPFLPPESSVYDVGCGWGGPLDMLARERGCRASGVTIARTQFRHVKTLGLDVRWADAERTLPPGRFDAVLFLESFEHLQAKAEMLRLMRARAGRVVMRVNCQDASPPSVRFGGSMPMISSAGLRSLLSETGWRVVHWRDRRAEAMPSIKAWDRRLRQLPPTNDVHLETHRQWCARLLRIGAEWGRCNPLIEVVAD